MNMFKPNSADTPEDYIAQIDEPRRSDIQKLHEFIKKTLPEFKPYMLSNIISYGKYHYKSKSGREGDWMVVGLASQKNYISVYACGTDKNEYVAEKYKDKFPKANIGRSCIRFKKVEDIDLEALKKVILESKKSLEKELVD